MKENNNINNNIIKEDTKKIEGNKKSNLDGSSSSGPQKL